MILDYVLRRFVDVARPEILRDHTPDSCIASTRITIDVFRGFRFEAEPLEVVASVGNGIYSDLRAQLGPPKDEATFDEWTREHGAEVVGIGHEASSGGIGGHLVAVIESGFLVDASLGQANSAAPTLQVPSVLVIQLKPSELLRGLIRRQDSSLFVEYGIRPALGDWRDSPDWEGTAETRAAVERILALIGNSQD